MSQAVLPLNAVEEKVPPLSMVILTVIIGALMSIIDASIINVALSSISGNLGASTSEVTSISTVYILANVIIMPLNGYLTAFFGRKNYYALCLFLFTVSSMLCGIAWDLNSLVFFRLIQGIGGGALMPTAQAIMFESFPQEKRGQAMAIFGLAAMVGPAIGPTLGGWLVDSYSWRTIFFINVPPGIIAVIMTFLFIRNPAYMKKPEGRFDIIGLLSMIIGISTLQYFLEKGQENDWFDSRIITACAISSIVFLTFFVIWETKIKNPIVDLKIFKDTTFAAGNVLGVVTGFGLYGLNLILPLFLSTILGYNSFQSGMAVLPGAIATAFAMPMVGNLVSKFDPRLLIAPGIFVFSLSGWLLSGLTTSSGYWDFFFPRVIQGFSLAFIFVPLSTIAMGQIPAAQMANASGLFSLMRQLGGSIGIAIMTTLLGYYSKLEYGHLMDYVNSYNPAATERLQLLQSYMMSKGTSADIASQQALTMLKGIVQKQSLMLAYDNLFQLTAFVFVCSSALLVFVKTQKTKKQSNDDGAEMHMIME